MKPLAIIPTYLRDAGDLALLETTVRSINRTVGNDVDVLIVDDGSPTRIAEEVQAPGAISCDVVCKDENTGFSSTVNVGLRRALAEGRNAFLINADIDCITKGWVEKCEQQPELEGDKRASVVGALLLFPSKLIQHAGIYFSLLTRGFNHYYKYGPHNLPEARVPAIRPVTGAFQFIRHETLANVGVYDEDFKMGFEDVDYCIRVLLSGRECVYQPAIRAYHHESVFRGRKSEKVERWQVESAMRLAWKYREQSFAGLVPQI